MFGQISEQFAGIIKNIRGLGKITDSNIKETVRKVRRTLIEADVNMKVVKSFISEIEKKAQGTKVIKSIKPGEQFVKIIKDEIVDVLDAKDHGFSLNDKQAFILLVGLQGAGKTTTAGKLALKLREEGKAVLLASSDIYRPAAINQLSKIGKQINVPIFKTNSNNPLKICKDALEEAQKSKKDVVILDTAGRLHIDTEMMEELKSIVVQIKPSEILFVVDGMTGQDAVKSAYSFNIELPITGLILTKMDGDARGGAALSIRKIVDAPIKFLGVSESLYGLEEFDPERIANRILGLHDIVTLVEKAQNIFDNDETEKISRKFLKNTFDLNDFKIQLKQMKNLDSINDIFSLLPNTMSSKINKLNLNPKHIVWNEAIIDSMTNSERKNPDTINGSCRLRISKGSGRSLQEVNALIKQYKDLKVMMKKIKTTNNKNSLVMTPNYRKF